MKNMLYIRTDMNSVIATGHMMRCLSIADAANSFGMKTTFIVADDNAAELLEHRGYEYIILNSNWNDLESELNILCGLIKEKQIELLLVDSYQVTFHYLEHLDAYTKVVYIDDLGTNIYSLSGLICYANYFKKFDFENRYRQALCGGRIHKIPEMYLGCQYVPLRAEFRRLKPKIIKETLQRVLILSGGTDPYYVSQQVLDAIDVEKYSQIDVVFGKYYEHVESMKQTYSIHTNIKFHQNISNLVELMLSADVVVSAGGTTLYELCAVGTPTITYSFADNQLDNVKQFNEDKIMKYAGDARYDDISEKINELLAEYADREVRQIMSAKMQCLVDGHGAWNICRRVLQKEKIHV